MIVNFICTMPAMSAAERIFQIVREAGIPDRNARSAIATACGVSVQAVKAWQDGKTQGIQHKYLTAFAKKYRISIEWLLTGEGAKDASEAREVEQLAQAIESLPPEHRAKIEAEIEFLLSLNDKSP